MSEEFVDLIDENDKAIGKVSRKDMRKRNLWHRSTAILVFNSKGELLIQKRAMAKDAFPGYYDFFFGGCLACGESYDENAIRELGEETGLKGIKPEFLFHSKYGDDKTRVHFNVYRVLSDGPFGFQEEEVEKAFFVTIKEAKEMAKKEKFCHDSAFAFEKYLRMVEK